MLKYSHVQLSITSPDGPPDEITRHLGVKPTRVREHEYTSSKSCKPSEKIRSWSWDLESPKDANHEPCARVEALLDLIKPFSERLCSLDPKFKRSIDCLFHCTHQAGEPITGQFDWLMLGPEQLKRMADLGVMFGYETMHFDEKWYDEHMKRKANRPNNFLHRIFQTARGLKNR